MAKYAVQNNDGVQADGRNGQSSASPVATVSGHMGGMVSAPPPMTSVHGAPVTMHAGHGAPQAMHPMMQAAAGHMPPRPPPGMPGMPAGPPGHPQFAAAMGMPPMGFGRPPMSSPGKANQSSLYPLVSFLIATNFLIFSFPISIQGETRA